MFSDYYFQKSTAALSVQVDLIKKNVYFKICGAKSVTNNWPTWDWSNGLIYTVNFEELGALTTEIQNIVNGTSPEPTTKRSYSDGSKIIAFGKSPSDNQVKIAIQNTTNGDVKKTSFTFINTDDLNKFLMLMAFVSQRKDQFFFAEFIINSVYNLIRAELYKTNTTTSSYTKGSTTDNKQKQQPYQNKQTSQASSVDDMFADNSAPNNNVNKAVNNVVSDLSGASNKQTGSLGVDIDDLL